MHRCQPLGVGGVDGEEAFVITALVLVQHGPQLLHLVLGEGLVGRADLQQPRQILLGSGTGQLEAAVQAELEQRILGFQL